MSERCWYAIPTAMESVCEDVVARRAGIDEEAALRSVDPDSRSEGRRLPETLPMSFLAGLDCFGHGARLALAKPLRRFVWVPMALSFFTLSLLLVPGHRAVETTVTWMVGFVPGWLEWLGTGLALLLYVLGVVVALWAFGFVSVLLASPFLGTLSARAEREAFGDGPNHHESMARAVASTLAREGRKLTYHLPRLAGLFVLTLIPIVNVAAPLLWLAFGAWMLALHFVDYASENRGLKLDDTIALLRSNPVPTLGFGAVVALLMAVPFAALVVIPAAACGGAVLWRRLA